MVFKNGKKSNTTSQMPDTNSCRSLNVVFSFVVSAHTHTHIQMSKRSFMRVYLKVLPVAFQLFL